MDPTKFPPSSSGSSSDPAQGPAPTRRSSKSYGIKATPLPPPSSETPDIFRSTVRTVVGSSSSAKPRVRRTIPDEAAERVAGLGPATLETRTVAQATKIQDVPDNGNCFNYSVVLGLYSERPEIQEAIRKYNLAVTINPDKAKADFANALEPFGRDLRQRSVDPLLNRGYPGYSEGEKEQILKEGIIPYQKAILAEQQSLETILKMLEAPLKEIDAFEKRIRGLNEGREDPKVIQGLLNDLMARTSQDQSVPFLNQGSSVQEIMTTYRNFRVGMINLYHNKQAELVSIRNQFISQDSKPIEENFKAEDLSDKTIFQFFSKSSADTRLPEVDTIMTSLEETKKNIFSEEEKWEILDGLIHYNLQLTESRDSLIYLINEDPDTTADQRLIYNEQLRDIERRLVRSKKHEIIHNGTLLKDIDDMSLIHFLSMSREDSKIQISNLHIRSLSESLKRPIAVWTKTDAGSHKKLKTFGRPTPGNPAINVLLDKHHYQYMNP